MTRRPTAALALAALATALATALAAACNRANPKLAAVATDTAASAPTVASAPAAMPVAATALARDTVIADALRDADEVVVYSRAEERPASSRFRGAATLSEVVVTGAASGTGSRLAARKDGGDAARVVPGVAVPVEASGVYARLEARDSAGQPVAQFPLRHTQVSAEISGYLARTIVEQRFEHPSGAGNRPVEAVYVFPLPAAAAVHDFVMRVGDRTIVGVVRPRGEALRIYQEARARGQTASLLEQERPNVFTQSVANIPVDEAVTVRIGYVERLPYEHGEYSYVFPMVVGPRYSPSAPSVVAVRAVRGGEGEPEPRSGVSAGVPDAARITPPLLKPGTRSGHDVGLVVTLDAGVPVRDVAVRSHDVTVEQPSATRRVVTLARHDSIPNRDFVLRWRVGGDATQFGILAHRAEGGSGYFSLLAQPPRAPADEQVVPREVTFIMDVSGSMMGVPIDIAKGLVSQSLDRLRPDDRFNIVFFASGDAQLWERARPNTSANVREARAFLQTLQGAGGTEMLAGLRRALSARHDPEHLQMFVFLTDGFVGNEDEILRVVKEERGDARFFGFGIGSSVNRYLIDGIGEHGAGTSMVVTPREAQTSDLAVGRLFAAIDSPVLVDVAVDWNGLPVADVYPRKPRDLFAGQTLALVGRFTRPARGTAYVTGRAGKREVRIAVPVDFAGATGGHAALAPAWARA
ncbi:MAG: VIT domain-containing protein, partial [Gemmatimonadaceae bacterium]